MEDFFTFTMGFISRGCFKNDLLLYSDVALLHLGDQKYIIRLHDR